VLRKQIAHEEGLFQNHEAALKALSAAFGVELKTFDLKKQALQTQIQQLQEGIEKNLVEDEEDAPREEE
jgi:hypothetical protein